MDIKVLQTVLESNSDYFIIESYNTCNNDLMRTNYLILIGLPEILKNIRKEKDMETITVKEFELFKNTYIEQNIFLFPKYAPFQIGQKPFYHAIDCLPLKDFELSELLNANLKTIWDVKKLLKLNDKDKS